MSAKPYKYREHVQRGTDALNVKDYDRLFAPENYSAHFTKHLGPQSMKWPPQTREQWREDLTSGFVGEMYVRWHITIEAYWEDVENRSAIAWFREKGLFVDDQEYEQDYVMRYEFDEDDKIVNIWELTDSYLQRTLAEKWEKGAAARRVIASST